MDESRKRPPQNTRPNARGQIPSRDEASRGRGSSPNNGANSGNGDGARKRSLSDYKPGAASSDADSAADQPTKLKGGGLLKRFAGSADQGQAGARDKTLGASQGKSQSKPKGKTNDRDSAAGQRAPRAGEWSASDFDSHELEAWAHQDDAPFELPESPDDTYERTIQEARRARERSRGGVSYQRYDESAQAGRDRRNARGRREPEQDWSSSAAYKAYDPYDSRERRSAGRRASSWDDDDDIEWDEGWDDGWQTGEWDTGWATGMRPAQSSRGGGRDRARDDWDDDDVGYDPRYEQVGYGPRGAGAANRRPGQGGRDRRDAYEEDDLSQSLNTLAQLSAVGAPLSRLARVRMLFRRRPTAAAMLAFFLLGFMLTCCATMIPLVRLGYDSADAYSRVTKLQTIMA